MIEPDVGLLYVLGVSSSSDALRRPAQVQMERLSRCHAPGQRDMGRCAKASMPQPATRGVEAHDARLRSANGIHDADGLLRRLQPCARDHRTTRAGRYPEPPGAGDAFIAWATTSAPRDPMR